MCKLVNQRSWQAKSGTSLIEILVYLSLLAGLSMILFSFAWHIKQKEKTALAWHTTLHQQQTALAILAQDLQLSQAVQQPKGPRGGLICLQALGTIRWQINENNELLRMVWSGKRQKPNSCKLADGIEKLHLIKINHNLMQVTLIDRQGQQLHSQNCRRIQDI